MTNNGATWYVDYDFLLIMYCICFPSFPFWASNVLLPLVSQNSKTKSAISFHQQIIGLPGEVPRSNEKIAFGNVCNGWMTVATRDRGIHYFAAFSTYYYFQQPALCTSVFQTDEQTNKSLFSFLRTLTTWHCPHSPAAAAGVSDISATGQFPYR